jgi:nucleotide-binding universal stress UspA family protein
MYRSIMVPLDGSPSGEHALVLALAIAGRAEVPVQMVRVHVPLAAMYAEGLSGFESSLDPRQRELEQAYLQKMVQRIHAASSVPVSAALLDGPIAPSLEEHVQASHADLVVMSTHGRGPLSRFWLGSVADHFVRHVSVPTLLVRPSDAAPDLTQRPLLRRFLVPLDGTPLAEQILKPAAALAKVMQAEFTLLRVVEPSLPVGLDPLLYGQAVADESTHVRQEESQVYLERVAERLRDQAFRVETVLVTHPNPATAILDLARTKALSLIALQTHGRRGLSRLLLGSVADKVVRGACVPVLISRVAET